MTARKVILLIILLATLPGVASVYVINKQTEDRLRVEETDNNDTQVAATLEACRRGNLLRAYELANESDGPQRAELARDLEPIVWCQQSVLQQKTVLIPVTVQDQYVEAVVKKRCWPRLSDDYPARIVACDPLPSDSQPLK